MREMLGNLFPEICIRDHLAFTEHCFMGIHNNLREYIIDTPEINIRKIFNAYCAQP